MTKLQFAKICASFRKHLKVSVFYGNCRWDGRGGTEAKSWAGQANSRRIFKMAPQFECNKMIEERKLKIKVSTHTHTHSHGHGIDIKYCENI